MTLVAGQSAVPLEMSCFEVYSWSFSGAFGRCLGVGLAHRCGFMQFVPLLEMKRSEAKHASAHPLRLAKSHVLYSQLIADDCLIFTHSFEYCPQMQRQDEGEQNDVPKDFASGGLLPPPVLPARGRAEDGQ